MKTKALLKNPKVYAILSEVSAFLTVLAAIPYELGEAAALLPPNAKTWIASIGVFATLGLRIIKRVLEPSGEAQRDTDPHKPSL